MVDFGWLLSPLQRHLPMQLPGVEPSRGLGPIDEDVELATLPWADERANLSDLITRLLSDDTTVRGRRIGASAVVACSPEERTLLRSAIAEHATSGPCQTLEVTSAHLEVAPQDLVRALTDDDALARLCEGAAVRRFGSVFGHDTLSLAGGTLTTHIQDHDVQIAQAASAGDPIVRPLFDGGSLWCSPLRVSEDRIVAWFDAGHQEGFKDPRIVETFLSSPAIGSPAREGLAADFEDLVLKIDLELASTREIHGRALLALVPGKWTVLAAQPYDSDEMVQLIAVKASLVER